MVSTLRTKGRLGKSTHTANHAVMNAANGWRVLVVDLDSQGNMARLLGYDARHGGGDDGGAELFAAFTQRRPPRVLSAVAGHAVKSAQLAGTRRVSRVVVAIAAAPSPG